MSTKIYRVGDKVLVDELYGTGSTVVTIDRVFFYGDQETVRFYRAGKRQFQPSEIHGPADETPANEREQASISSTGGEKNVKPEKFSLIPVEALAKVAEHYGVGAKKYSAHQWRKGYEWSKSYDALQRHATSFWAGEDNDTETGTPHMAAVAFHALTLLTFMDEQRDHDDRYKDQS